MPEFVSSLSVRTRLVPIVVVVLLFGSALGALGANHGAPISPGGQVALYDSHGRLIAVPFEVQHSYALLTLKTDRLVVALQATQEGFIQYETTIGTTLVFESTDCTGQAYDEHNPEDLARPGAWFDVVVLNGTRLYSISDAAREITFQSKLDESDGTTCTAQTFTGTFTPVQFLADLAQFQPPFSLR